MNVGRDVNIMVREHSLNRLRLKGQREILTKIDDKLDFWHLIFDEVSSEKWELENNIYDTR